MNDLNTVAVVDDLNNLAFTEFLSLLNSDQTIAQDWKDAINGCTVNGNEVVLDSFEEFFLP